MFPVPAVCGAPDTLVVMGYSLACGVVFQWQYSVDGATWVNMSAATSTVWPCYNPHLSLFYRCIATCSSTGLFAYSSAVYVPATTAAGLSSVTVPPDILCNGVEFYVSACDTSTAYSVVSYYGDAKCDTNALSTTGVRHADIYHHYAFPGTYSVKQVLYDGLSAVDSTAFSYEYLYCSTLPVVFYFDANNNCINDVGETNYTPLLTEVDSNGIAIDTISATSGFYYQAFGPPGTIYNFKIIDYPSSIIISCPSTNILSDTIQSLVNMYPIKSFGLNCGVPGFDLVVHAVIPVTGNHDQWGNIYVHNNSPLLCGPIYSRLVLNFSPKYSEEPSVPSLLPHYIGGNTIMWDVKDVDSKPLDIWYAVWGPSLKIGDTVHTRVTINPKSGDVDTANNTEVIIDTVRAGCDPNFILVSPARCLLSGITANELRYTIAFENTGNDTAHNIHIMDTLSDNVDPRTLQLVDASAQMNIALFNVDGHNIVKFDFPGINLLDSSHHGFCDGMVMYNIKTRAGLADGTSIQNHAGIFFDINPVVLTNTVENIIGCGVLGIKNTDKTFNVELYPNPAKDELTINIDRDAYTSFIITNQVGQVLVQKNIVTQQTKVDTKAFAAGLYYITLKGDNGAIVRKFVKI